MKANKKNEEPKTETTVVMTLDVTKIVNGTYDDVEKELAKMMTAISGKCDHVAIKNEKRFIRDENGAAD